MRNVNWIDAGIVLPAITVGRGLPIDVFAVLDRGNLATLTSRGL